jgi:uncharacterized protein
MIMDYIKLEKDVIKQLRHELSHELYYHQVEHTIDVVRDTEIIGQAEGIKGDDLLLLKSAALLHDSGFLKSPCKNENQACQIAEGILPNYGYSSKQIKMIEGMILATSIPQKPTNLFEEIICDADLAYLGDNDPFTHAKNLRREMKMVQNCKFSDTEWIDFQLNFLQSHKFFTSYAQEYMTPGKRQYVKILLNEKQVLGGE